MYKVVIVTGPTATGKTKLALELAKKYNGVLINCDSRQIYKGLDIITGKDINNKIIKLYDIVDPKKNFSSFDFQKLAQPLIEEIIKQGKVPIVVGGTYFYIYHLLYQIETENIVADWKLRTELGKKTVLELQEILKKLAPNLKLNQSDFNNPQRLVRKIEISQYQKFLRLLRLRSGQVRSGQANIKDQNDKAKIKELPFKLKEFYRKVDLEFIGLKYGNKDDLIGAIRERTKKRLEQGAIDEVKNLLKQGYLETDPGMKTIGYQQIIRFLKGKITKEQAIEQWINKEIQYAKRQMTFMKKDPNIKWIGI